MSETLNYASNSAAEKARKDGYYKGRSDAVKQQYWIMVNQQRSAEQANQDIALYEIPIPEQEIDGVMIQPTTRVLRSRSRLMMKPRRYILALISMQIVDSAGVSSTNPTLSGS